MKKRVNRKSICGVMAILSLIYTIGQIGSMEVLNGNFLSYVVKGLVGIALFSVFIYFGEFYISN